MAKKTKQRQYAATRKFVLRVDATVGTGIQKIESVFGLPQGSVQLTLPTGKRARVDKKIGALLDDWDT